MDSLEDSPEWSRKYDVFSISRLYLVHSLAFTYEQVRMLSTEDMFYIADLVRDSLLHSLVSDFDVFCKRKVALPHIKCACLLRAGVSHSRMANLAFLRDIALPADLRRRR
jgi:hypothetical protein